jgi:hypothetical protein
VLSWESAHTDHHVIAGLDPAIHRSLPTGWMRGS